MLEYCYKACEFGIKEQIVEMAINSCGIRGTAPVLKINKNTVISALKSKENSLIQVNPLFYTDNKSKSLEVRLEQVCVEAEADEQWSFVGNKGNQRWLWHALIIKPTLKIREVCHRHTSKRYRRYRNICG